MSNLKAFIQFIGQIISSRRVLFSLIKSDFKAQYLGTYLGLIWAFVQPMVLIGVMWFVFQVGFKAAPVKDFPFILWLCCGMIPWFFFSESVSKGADSVVSKSFLVKKIIFRVSTLPIVKIASSLIIHIFFVFFLMAMFIYYGYLPSIYWLQLPYFVGCTVVLVLGISWLTSALMVFVRDVRQAVGVILQLGFWMTPIFWSSERIPDRYIIFLKLNPMFYIVEGYRNTFIDHMWFWETTRGTPYFLLTTGFIFVLGAIVFKRLRPHFADVL